MSKMKGECEMYKTLAGKARSVWDKLRKERDYHKMHHRRVVQVCESHIILSLFDFMQEKDKLVRDIRRLKKHIDGYSLLHITGIFTYVD